MFDPIAQLRIFCLFHSNVKCLDVFSNVLIFSDYFFTLFALHNYNSKLNLCNRVLSPLLSIFHFIKIYECGASQWLFICRNVQKGTLKIPI